VTPYGSGAILRMFPASCASIKTLKWVIGPCPLSLNFLWPDFPIIITAEGPLQPNVHERVNLRCGRSPVSIVCGHQSSDASPLAAVWISGRGGMTVAVNAMALTAGSQ